MSSPALVLTPGAGPLSEQVAAALTGDAPYLAVAPAGTDPGVVDALVRDLQREPSVAGLGVGSGGLVDALGLPAAPYVLRTAALADVGGPHPLFDDDEPLGRLDLGWRLRAGGWRVCTVGPAETELPAVVVDAPAPPTPEHLALHLVVVHRNLGEESLHAILPAALAATRRLPGGAAADEAYQRLLPVQQRVRAQATRTRPDLEVLAFVRADPGALPAGTYDLSAGEGRRLLDGRHRVGVLCPDVVGTRMAGPAIRAWELAHALAAEHDVVLVATLAEGDDAVTTDALRLVDKADPSMRAAVTDCDVVLLQGWFLHDYPWIADLPVVMVADLYDPTHLETLEADRDRPVPERQDRMDYATDILLTQVARADFFLCASPRQRDLWLGHLAAARRINPYTYDGDESLRRLVAEVPFGVASTPPARGDGAIKGVVPGIGPDDEVILWGGGIYNWFDPLTLIRAVALVAQTRPQVRLFFLGTRHPNPGVPEMAMAGSAYALADSLGLTGTHVFFNSGWVPYTERARFFTDADLGVSCHYEHLETAFAFRTRMLDYLWAGLPIVATGGDHFGDLIAARGLGAVVPPEDAPALAAALLGLLGDPERMAACRAAVAEAAADMGWERLAAPLLEFCRRPARARDAFLHAKRPGADGPPPTPLQMLRTTVREGGAPLVARRVVRKVRAAVR